MGHYAIRVKSVLAPTAFFASLPSDIGSEDLLYPLALLDQQALLHNISTMSQYCSQMDVALAPHGKTTMCPDIWKLQLDAGARGITAATTWQASVMVDAGVGNVLIANEVVDPREIRWIDSILADSRASVACFVDSARGVELLRGHLSRSVKEGQPLDVFLEVGYPGGRCGVRTLTEATKVAGLIEGSPGLRLIGVAGFEGILAGEPNDTAVLGRVSEYCQFVGHVADVLMQEGKFGVERPTISAGGSAYFDIVIEAVRELGLEFEYDILLRSGCYVTHSHGGYEYYSPMGGHRTTAQIDKRLRPALRVLGQVLSRPEPSMAVVGVGKRDVSPDGGLPSVLGVHQAMRPAEPLDAVVTSLNDQHAIVNLGESGKDLQVGDVVAFGVTHPCTTFDKWREVFVDSGSGAIDCVYPTYF